MSYRYGPKHAAKLNLNRCSDCESSDSDTENGEPKEHARLSLKLLLLCRI